MSVIGYPSANSRTALGGISAREADPSDAPAILQHFRALDPTDRRMRFLASLSDGALARHVEGIWQRNALVLAAGAPGAGPIRGLAEVALTGGAAEIGLSVDGALRRRGVGTYLLERVGHLLAQRGARSVLAFTMPGNASMIALARKFGARIEYDPSEVAITFSVEALDAAYCRRLLPEIAAPAA